MIGIIDKLIPILLLFVLGHWMARKNWFSEEAMGALKQFVIKVALSATLFKVFIEMELKKEYFLIIVLTLVLMCLLFLTGHFIGKIPLVNEPLAGFTSSGFAFGTLGIPLFAIVYGSENLGALSVYGVGHELFVWFIYYNLVKLIMGHERLTPKFLLDMLRSPLIIAVFSGLFLNLIGVSQWVQTGPGISGVYTAIGYLSQLITPLILIIVGYNLKFEKAYMRAAVKLSVIRFLITGGVGLAFFLLVLNNVFDMTPMMINGYVVLLLLSPPTSLSLFVGQSAKDDNQQHIANNTVVLYTVVSMVLFTLYVTIQTLF